MNNSLSSTSGVTFYKAFSEKKQAHFIDLLILIPYVVMNDRGTLIRLAVRELIGRRAINVRV